MTSEKSPTQLNSASGMMFADESWVQVWHKPPNRRLTSLTPTGFEDIQNAGEAASKTKADDCETANYYCHYKPENIGCRLVLREIDNWKLQVGH